MRVRACVCARARACRRVSASKREECVCICERVCQYAQVVGEGAHRGKYKKRGPAPGVLGCVCVGGGGGGEEGGF